MTTNATPDLLTAVKSLLAAYPGKGYGVGEEIEGLQSALGHVFRFDPHSTEESTTTRLSPKARTLANGARRNASKKFAFARVRHSR